MRCKKCGHENPQGAKYCGYCQWKLPEYPEKEEKPGNKRKLKWLLPVTGVLLVIAVVFCLFSGPSVEDVEAEIDAIGTVTINSEEQLRKIVEMSKSLSVEEQEQIRNIDVLMEASEELARQAEVMVDASDAICALGEITLDSKDAVASAREKYDQAAIYDINGVLTEHKTILEAAEAELAVLIKEQEQSLEYALSNIDDVVSRFFTGDYSWGETSFQEQIDKLQNKSDCQQYADSVMERICTWAQTSYEKGSYVAAVTVLQNSDVVRNVCDADAAAVAENLEESFVQELNSKAPKNGKVLERTFTKGTNVLTLTAGSADTCVKIRSVNDNNKFAVMYIRANQKASLYNILNDEYEVMYTTGPVWYGEEDMFGPDATYILMPQTIDPNLISSSGMRRWTTYSGTLTVGYGDQYGVQNMDPNDF